MFQILKSPLRQISLQEEEIEITKSPSNGQIPSYGINTNGINDYGNIVALNMQPTSVDTEFGAKSTDLDTTNVLAQDE